VFKTRVPFTAHLHSLEFRPVITTAIWQCRPTKRNELVEVSNCLFINKIVSQPANERRFIILFECIKKLKNDKLHAINIPLSNVTIDNKNHDNNNHRIICRRYLVMREIPTYLSSSSSPFNLLKNIHNAWTHKWIQWARQDRLERSTYNCLK